MILVGRQLARWLRLISCGDPLKADSFAAGCIVSCIGTGSLDNTRIAVLKGCLSDIERELPALSAEAKDYFERFSRIGKSVISQPRETR